MRIQDARELDGCKNWASRSSSEFKPRQSRVARETQPRLGQSLHFPVVLKGSHIRNMGHIPALRVKQKQIHLTKPETKPE